MLRGIDADPPRATSDGPCRRTSRLMIYIRPSATETLQRYGVEHSSHSAKTKVHDVALEALEV